MKGYYKAIKENKHHCHKAVMHKQIIMETQIITKEKNVKIALHDILLDITWAKIAKRYFGKSAGWIYNKLNGVDGNGGKGDFTEGEREQLRGALVDFSDRLRTAANKL